MDKTAIRNVSIWARESLIQSIRKKAYEYGIGDAAENGSFRAARLSDTERRQRAALLARVERSGLDAVIEEVAYTWFNRFVALRFLEVNGFLPSRVRVFGDMTGRFRPDILREALTAEIPDVDRAEVLALSESRDEEALYRYLLLAQCGALSEAFPGLFERRGDADELLLPDNLLKEGSVPERLVGMIPEEDWRDGVEIIGWMYQYYQSRRHDEVININRPEVRKADIPAATQLFTPDWVVRYMVDNTLGRYWLEHSPNSGLREKLAFYVPAGMTGAAEPVDPRDISFLDPCMGSGHILAYAFDVFLEIYRECGYSDREACAWILDRNLYGLDIDERCSQLAAFSLMMKARAADRRFLTRGIRPNAFAIEESGSEEGAEAPEPGEMTTEEYLRTVFRNAKEAGSLIRVEPRDYSGLFEESRDEEARGQLGLWDASDGRERRRLARLARQAELLSRTYTIVCANPPYLNKLSESLRAFVRMHYAEYSGDLFSAFIVRCLELCDRGGLSGFMTPFVWMFIRSYAGLRRLLFTEKELVTLIQMEYSAFEEATVPICAFAARNREAAGKGAYIRLSDFRGGMDVQRDRVLEAIRNPACGYLYESDQRDFLKIPGMPAAYWLSARLLEAFERGTLLGELAAPRVGLQTGDNRRFLRLWFECAAESVKWDAASAEDSRRSPARWYPHNKGGAYRKWYGNAEYVVDYRENGRDLREGEGSTVISDELAFHEAITYSRVGSGGISFRVQPEGFLFDSAAVSMFPEAELREYLLGLLNGKIVRRLISAIAPTLNTQPGDIAKLPVLRDDARIGEVRRLVRDCVGLAREDWNAFETSWEFKSHPLA